MATFTTVEKDMAQISVTIDSIRTRLANAKAQFAKAVTALDAMATDYADTIATINAADAEDVAWAVKQAELALKITEFQGLKTDAQTAATGLESLTEF